MHLYISYAKRDTRELALNLAQALNAVDGMTAWVDRALQAGASWELQIQSEIDRCDTMIVLYSPDINRHKQGEPASFVLTEIAYARRTAHKPIIPVMVQLTDPPISLTLAHYIDFTHNGLTLNDLVDALCNQLQIGKRPPIPLPSLLPSEVLLPPPFAWIAIPAGEITLAAVPGFFGGGETFPIAAFSIGKYPVTNAQYAKFIEAGGYYQRKWWTVAGWQMCETRNWRMPSYWDDAKWTGSEQPIVGVSWDEAVAFCRWLSETTGENIMLPTEQQWQWAAQGDDGRLYPWGNQWQPDRCNSNAYGTGIGRTTPVTHYEGTGDSPFGVVDMAGNVWEWCRTVYETGSQDMEGIGVHTLRGGSFVDSLNFLQVASRDWVLLVNDLNVGFRLARST